MIENDIIQRPAKSIITVHGKYTVMQTNSTVPMTANSSTIITLGKINVRNTVIYPGQHVDIMLPPTVTCEKVAIEPRVENRVSDLASSSGKRST